VTNIEGVSACTQNKVKHTMSGIKYSVAQGTRKKMKVIVGEQVNTNYLGVMVSVIMKII